MKNNLSKEDRKQIERIVANKSKFYEKKNWRTFYNSVNSMSYNYRDLVLSTWKLLKKPFENNLIIETSDEEDEYDNEIKEVTVVYETSSDEESDNDKSFFKIT